MKKPRTKTQNKSHGKNTRGSGGPRAGGKGKPSLPTRQGKPSQLPKGARSVPGIHSVKEALNTFPHDIHSIWLKPGWDADESLTEIGEVAKSQRIPIVEKHPQELDRIVSGHQGVLCHVMESPELNWSHLEEKEKSILIALDGLEDPHNLGAILRTSWLMGVDGILVPEMRAAHLTPAALKVASGGAEHVPVQVESNLAASLKSLKDIGYWIYGLSHKASGDVWSMNYPEKVVWVIGSEAKGMRAPVENICDELVSIPQVSAHASYNASVAAAIALSETSRQHR